MRRHKLHFSVDAALLRELGERLVGRAHIALAELIKNAYDADATVVDVAIGTDAIVVRDNGHGMTYDEFRTLWMRIGSPHKERQVESRELKRPLTGSKGVGRLAAQFLAHSMDLRTISDHEPAVETFAEIDWDDALTRGALTDAEAIVRTRHASGRFAAGSASGTSVRMAGLKQDWDETALQELARELWPLQPPFDRQAQDNDDDDDDDEMSEEGDDEKGESESSRSVAELLAELDVLDAADDRATVGGDGFRIRLRTVVKDEAEQFERQMRRVLDIWSARITGRLARTGNKANPGPATLEIEVTWPDGRTKALDRRLCKTRLHELEFEIRVFDLHHRQRYRIPVDAARKYLRRNGGVHVYDAGFHLPYYGADTDWLNLERDHANRLSLSELLPSELNVKRGLNALPTNRRVYGIVDIDTARERRMTHPDRRQRDALTIQVSRDRLVDNIARQDLRMAVRTAIDFYAVEETRSRAAHPPSADTEPPPQKVERVRDVLERHRDSMPSSVYREVTSEIDGVLSAIQTEAEQQAAQAGMLGALATAGISALAYEHEFNRQLAAMERLGRRLRRVKDAESAVALASELDTVIQQARTSRQLFAHLLEADDFERTRPRARSLIEATVQQLRQFMRGVEIDASGVPEDLRLPAASVAEWTSLFQNVLVNAANAMLDSDERRVDIAAGRGRSKRWIRMQDTGAGIDLQHAERLFEPFAREQRISSDRRQLGFGGTGLGLTIVRMLAARAGCSVRFVEADDKHSTAFELSWSET